MFPFTYKSVKYTGCILVDADDGKPWCSTLTDGNGVHVGGQGQWGHCPSSCPVDKGDSGQQTEETVHVNVQGGNSISNTKLTQIPWLNNGDLPPTAAAALGVAGGVSPSEVNNRFFFGLNEPDIGHQSCRAPTGGQGQCRHIHHCVEPVFFNFFTFLSHMCIIKGRYIGVCCPQKATIIETTTTTKTPAPTPNPTPAPPTRSMFCKF